VLARHGVAKHVSHPNQTMFADLIGQEFLDYIFETAPRKVGSRVRKSLDHFCKGASLEGIDDEMGAIRLIAAEEELVVAIFEWLKLNADKMPEHADFVRKYKNHNVKLAFHPVLSQFWNALGYMFSDGLTLEGLEEYLYWTPRPILHDNKLLLQFIDNDGKEFIKQNPLAIKVSRSDLSDEEVIEEMFKDFAKLIQDQQKMTVSEFISIRADYRNKLLYASDAGYVAMDDSLKDLIEIFKSTYRDLLWTLATLLGNSPPGKGFGLVSQFIALYRRVLVEARLI
jgi:hypothetical protein